MRKSRATIRYSTATLAALVSIATTWSSASAEIDFDALMSAEEMASTGVAKLSDQERASLERWLEAFVAAQTRPDTQAPPAPTESHPIDQNWGFTNPPETEEEAEAELRAAIVGPFTGWNGKTVFSLDNGQVWKQRRSGYFRYRGDSREVLISKNRFGFFEMRLIDADRSIGVTRVK